MGTLHSQYSDPLMSNIIGQTTGSATALQFPDTPCLMLKFKALSGNVGSFFLGDQSGNTYWELDAGQETDWIPVINMSRLWHRDPSGTLDKLSWWLQR